MNPSDEDGDAPRSEWWWAFHALCEFHVPLERFAGYGDTERMAYMAALSALWDQRREAEKRRNRRG